MTVRKENTTAGEAPPGAGLLDTLSRGHFGTSCPEVAGSVPTPEYAAIVGAPAKPHGFVGRGGAAERVSFAACGETSDTQLATTRQETFSGRTATESKMEGTHER